MATGLGSINVGNLLTLWSSAVRTPTTTTLSNLSGGTPSGQTFTAKVTVTPTPTGAAGTEAVALNALASDGITILGSIGASPSSSTLPNGTPFTLSGGIANITTNLLPPGTAFLTATYSGDVSLAASTSPQVALSVSGANQSSKTTLSFVTFDASNNPILNSSPQTAPYGSPYILRIDVTPSSGNLCGSGGTVTAFPCPTGKVTLTDAVNGGAAGPLNDWPNAGTPNATNVANLNNQGIAEDQPVQLGVGSHSIVAKYAGDPNYQASSNPAFSLTITKAATTTTVTSSAVGTIVSGSMVTLTALISTTSSGVGPTGNVQFANGTTNLGAAVVCTPTSGAQNATNGTAFCTATTQAAISALYPAPRYGPRPPVVPIVLLALSILAYLLALRWMPEGRRRAYAYTGLVAIALLAAGFAGCGGGSSGGGGGGGTTVTISATYSGDANYNTSPPGTTPIQVH